MAEKTMKGTVLKMAVNFAYPADQTVTLDTLSSWQTEWYTDEGLKTLTFLKNQHQRVSTTVEGVTTVQYYAYVPTNEIGKGKLYFRLKVDIPDGYVSGGYRTEYAEAYTNVVIG